MMTAAELRAKTVKTESATAPVLVADDTGEVLEVVAVEVEPKRLVIRVRRPEGPKPE